MTIVLNASAGIAIVFNRAKASLFGQELIKAEKVIASDVYKIEVANVIWKYVRAGLLEKQHA